MPKTRVRLVGIVILGFGLGFAGSELNGRLAASRAMPAAPGPAAAGILQSGSQTPNASEIEAANRSRAIQVELQRIDRDRAAWVSNFLAEWDQLLDPAVYSARSELTAVAMKAPAWQLYAASLVGDYATMIQVLRGTRSAGSIVNSLAQPQPKTRPAAFYRAGARPLNVGDNFNQLVFTPIPPCRVVDTRPGPDGAGARTGVLPANATRDFHLDASAFLSGQGGGPFPCPGLPTFSDPGWALNITVASGLYSAAGGLKAWGFNSPEPNASVINWQAGQVGAIANGVILIGCNGCFDDITIKAFGDATHVIIDVMGYFQEATATTATLSFFQGLEVIHAPGRVWIGFRRSLPRRHRTRQRFAPYHDGYTR